MMQMTVPAQGLVLSGDSACFAGPEMIPTITGRFSDEGLTGETKA